MEHTKKFVLMDPRFVRPTMRDKVLSALDSDISIILNSDVSDEAKAKSYVSALSRFKNYSAPPKPDKPIALPTNPPTPPAPPMPSKPLKASRKRVKKAKPISSAVLDQLLQTDSPLWKRTTRAQFKKKNSPQWIDYSGLPKLKKQKAASSKSWLEY